MVRRVEVRMVVGVYGGLVGFRWMLKIAEGEDDVGLRVRLRCTFVRLGLLRRGICQVSTDWCL